MTGPDDFVPPGGFSLARDRGPFSAHNGPSYVKRDGDRIAYGIHVLERHCNSHGIIHGGMLMTMADGLMAANVWTATGARMVTVRMTSDFLDMARAGDWVEGSASVTRATRTLAFADAALTARGRVIFQASGVFKLMRRKAQ